MSTTKGMKVVRKNPVGKLAETALSTLKDPKGAASKVVDQAKGTAALGRMVAETAGSVVGKAAGRATGRGARSDSRTDQAAPVAKSRPADEGSAPSPTLRAVPDVNEPAHTQPPGTADAAESPAKSRTATGSPAKKQTGRVPGSKKAGAKKTADSPKKHGDALVSTPTKATREAKSTEPETKPMQAKQSSTSEKTSTTTAKKPAPTAKKPATTEPAPAAKKPAKKPAKKVSATPADVAEVVEAAVAEDPKKTAAQPVRKTAKKGVGNAPAAKSSPGGKLPPRRSAPTGDKDGSSGKTGKDGSSGKTGKAGRSGKTGKAGRSGSAGSSTSDSGGVVDPAVAKRVASESETLRKAAETDPS